MKNIIIVGKYLFRVGHRFALSFGLIFVLILQALFSLCFDKTHHNILGVYLHYIRREYDEDNLKIIGYSLFPFLLVSILYFICNKKGIVLPCEFWKGEVFYPFAVAIGALIVTILLAININVKKIESHKQFYEKLLEHIAFLNYEHTFNLPKDSKLNLYIISPNINIGTGIGCSFVDDAIKNNEKICFIFICEKIEIQDLEGYPSGDCNDIDSKHNFLAKSNNRMLNFINLWYHGDSSKLDISVEELRKILELAKKDNTKIKIIPKYFDMLYSENGIGGYLSDYECAIGRFNKINIIKKNDNVAFSGDMTSSTEFIRFFKNCIEKETGTKEEVGKK